MQPLSYISFSAWQLNANVLIHVQCSIEKTRQIAFETYTSINAKKYRQQYQFRFPAVSPETGGTTSTVTQISQFFLYKSLAT